MDKQMENYYHKSCLMQGKKCYVEPLYGKPQSLVVVIRTLVHSQLDVDISDNE